MLQVNFNYKGNNTDTKCPLHYVKNQKTLQQSVCMNVKKLKSLHLVKKTAKENGKR